VVDKRMEPSMNNSEIRILRWMSEVTREHRILNEYVRGHISVVSIVDKVRENTEMIWTCDEKRRNKSNYEEQL